MLFWGRRPAHGQVQSAATARRLVQQWPMAIRPRRASIADLERILAGCDDDDLTYEPVGLSLGLPQPSKLTRRVWSVDLPDVSFDRAVSAIQRWEVHRGAGLEVLTDGAIAVGTNVAMCAPLPIGYIDVTCRIVSVVDEPSRYGFAYGTLSVHPEQGEESFVITRHSSGTTFDVVSVSRPVHPIARAVPFLGDILQDRGVRRYLGAMESASTNSG